MDDDVVFSLSIKAVPLTRLFLNGLLPLLGLAIFSFICTYIYRRYVAIELIHWCRIDSIDETCLS